MLPDMNSLKAIGFTESAANEFLNSKDSEQQILMLRKHRYVLLEEIHAKQRLLDETDFAIRNLKMTRGDL